MNRVEQRARSLMLRNTLLPLAAATSLSQQMQTAYEAHDWITYDLVMEIAESYEPRSLKGDRDDRA